MSEKIYISRKCEYCHELLILLHKHKDILKFPVIDVHSNPYPNIVKSVPCMVVDGKILPGDELFKFVNYLIQKNPYKIYDFRNFIKGRVISRPELINMYVKNYKLIPLRYFVLKLCPKIIKKIYFKYFYYKGLNR